MASGSRPRLALLVLIPVLCSGCFTGHLLEQSRIRESVQEYEIAYRDSGRLVLGYRALLEDAGGVSLGFRQRAAAVPLWTLRASPPLQVDAFPVERLRLRDLSPQARPIGESSLQMEVDGSDRHVGFWWSEDELEEPFHFHSGALNQSHHAWWAYPILPLTVAIDLLLLVPQIPAASPLFLSGE